MSDQLRKLVILHTNDIHSHFEQMPKVAAFFDSRREAYGAENVLTLDIGDHMDRMRPETEGTNGVANLAVLNATGYDAMVLGNNEGLTFTPDLLGTVYREHARFTVIGSNIMETATRKQPDWMLPYEIVRRAGLRIGLIGVTAAFTDYYELLGWTVTEPIETTRRLVDELRPEVDVLIVMSHLGLWLDQRMAEEIPGIDLILGGHTHHLLEEPLRIGGALVCAAGKFGQYAGEAHIAYDAAGRAIRELRARVVDLSGAADSSSIEALLEQYRASSREALDAEVAQLRLPLRLDWYGESQLGNLVAAGLRAWTRADIGLVNAGQLLQGLKEGRVTRGRLLEICPGPINPCRLWLSGADLLQALEESLLPEFMEKPIRGFGFRGEVLGMLCLDGIHVTFDSRCEPYHRVQSALVGGKPLDPDKEYTIGTVDMFTFGVGYLSLSKASRVEYLLPEFLRDVLAVQLQDEDAILRADERRWLEGNH